MLLPIHSLPQPEELSFSTTTLKLDMSTSRKTTESSPLWCGIQLKWDGQ
jgi:hypothetical protein